MTPPPALKYTNKLQGRRVLVLGGSTGVGFCVAEAALEHGAHVTISSSNQKKLDAAVARLRKHAQAVGIAAVDSVVNAKTCDLASPEAVEDNIVSLLEFAVRDGKLDHVVFTAGDALSIVPVGDITAADVQRMGMVRHVGPIVLAKHLPKYINQAVGSSFTLTGGSNAWRPGPGWSVAASFGAALEGLARGLAIDLRPVRVNCVQLGAVHTELFGGIPEDKLPAVLDSFRKEGITGTVGKPEEVAEAYIYCMKDSFATGAVVESNGGRLVGDLKGSFLFA
ncbi:hypothetical protein CDD83_8460 [Cordyceps sp. RAO-2017]|nr:hypothetical protein CDD83_8460 [Cordyceps sp. RAO-2017]